MSRKQQTNNILIVASALDYMFFGGAFTLNCSYCVPNFVYRGMHV